MYSNILAPGPNGIHTQPNIHYSTPAFHPASYLREALRQAMPASHTDKSLAGATGS